MAHYSEQYFSTLAPSLSLYVHTVNSTWPPLKHQLWLLKRLVMQQGLCLMCCICCPLYMLYSIHTAATSNTLLSVWLKRLSLNPLCMCVCVCMRKKKQLSVTIHNRCTFSSPASDWNEDGGYSWAEDGDGGQTEHWIWSSPPETGTHTLTHTHICTAVFVGPLHWLTFICTL